MLSDVAALCRVARQLASASLANRSRPKRKRCTAGARLGAHIAVKACLPDRHDRIVRDGAADSFGMIKEATCSGCDRGVAREGLRTADIAPAGDDGCTADMAMDTSERRSWRLNPSGSRRRSRREQTLDPSIQPLRRKYGPLAHASRAWPG